MEVTMVDHDVTNFSLSNTTRHSLPYTVELLLLVHSVHNYYHMYVD